MQAVNVVVIDVIPDEPPQVFFIQRDHVVQHFPAALPTHLSAVPFCHGTWILVRFAFSPADFRNAVTSPLKIESLSKITYL